MNVATQRVDPRDGGVAAAVVNTSQQIGGSLGVALLNTAAATATAGYLYAHGSGRQVHTEALIHGYTVAAGWAAATLFTSALLAAVLITAQAPEAGGRQAAGRNTDLSNGG
jgi:hypothetical protein